VKPLGINPISLQTQKESLSDLAYLAIASPYSLSYR
jgi:hypothetical protein